MRKRFNVRSCFYFIMLAAGSSVILGSVKKMKELTPEQRKSLKEIKQLEKDAKKLADEIKRHSNDKDWLDKNEDRLQDEYDRIYQAYTTAHDNGSLRIINMVSNAYSQTKESTIIDTKLNIYESYDNGYITEFEKYELLNMIESSDNNDLKHFSSKILDPEKLFDTGDDKYYIDASGYTDIVDDTKMQTAIKHIKSDAIKEMRSLIKELYDDWYEDINIARSDVNSLANKLFDVIDISDKGSDIVVGYWINSFSSHKNSKDFFGNHSMNVYYLINKKTYKYSLKYKPQLEG